MVHHSTFTILTHEDGLATFVIFTVLHTDGNFTGIRFMDRNLRVFARNNLFIWRSVRIRYANKLLVSDRIRICRFQSSQVYKNIRTWLSRQLKFKFPLAIQDFGQVLKTKNCLWYLWKNCLSTERFFSSTNILSNILICFSVACISDVAIYRG